MSDHKLFYLMHSAHHAIFKQADKHCREHLNISCVQLSALFYLQHNNGCLLKDLSAGLSLNNSAITGLVSRMLNTGLVTKKNCAQDARASRIYMTPKANEIVPAGLSLVKDFNKKMTSEFTHEELSIVARFLQSLSKMH